MNKTETALNGLSVIGELLNKSLENDPQALASWLRSEYTTAGLLSALQCCTHILNQEHDRQEKPS